jgi:hypothetical protein
MDLLWIMEDTWTHMHLILWAFIFKHPTLLSVYYNFCVHSRPAYSVFSLNLPQAYMAFSHTVTQLITAIFFVWHDMRYSGMTDLDN